MSTWNPSPSKRQLFLSPNAVLGGEGTTAEIGDQLSSRLRISAGSKVFVAVDDLVYEFGLVEPLLEGLVKAGYQYVVRGGFGAEPTSEVVDAIAKFAREEDARAVIGVGGGSVLDSSKIIALLLNNPGWTEDWIGRVEPTNSVAPLVLVPTTSGTGSETTGVAMVTVAGEKKASLSDEYFPQLAVIDPNMVSSLPKSVIASTGMDALAHASEAYMSSSVSMLSATHSLRAIELIRNNIVEAYEGNKSSLANVMWGSHIAGQALNAGVVLGHSLAYCLAHAQPMPHGTSCALALPYCIAYNQNLESGHAKRLARALTQGKSDSLRVAATDVHDLVARLGLPNTLQQADISENQIPEMASMCVGSYPRPTNPEPFDQIRIEELFKSMTHGDLDLAFSVTAI